jgi:hypothetical protein
VLSPVGADGADGFGDVVIGLGGVRQLVGWPRSNRSTSSVASQVMMGSMSPTWSARSSMGRQAAGQRLTANMKPAAQGWAMTVPSSARR